MGCNMTTSIISPKIEELLSPLLASLPAAAVSTQPPSALLPLLSPILRQRVQFLSSSTSNPWISLLSYDDTSEVELKSIASSNLLELHPVSGLVEIDWESDTTIQFNRVDCETLQALVLIRRLNLSIKLLWCINDPSGFDGCNGWRIGEVWISKSDDLIWGVDSICLAEEVFVSRQALKTENFNQSELNQSHITSESEEKKEDDNYWARYNEVAAQTPPPEQLPISSAVNYGPDGMIENDDEYYSQYDLVQPAMDSHNPVKSVDNSFYGSRMTSKQIIEASTIIEDNYLSLQKNGYETLNDRSVDSSILLTNNIMPHQGQNDHVSISSSKIVNRFEEQATSDFLSRNAIKTHIEASLKSLYRLARTTGIERGEFDRIVRVQLEFLSLMNDDGDDF